MKTHVEIDELDKIMRVLCEGLMGLMGLPVTKRLEFSPLTVPGACASYVARTDVGMDVPDHTEGP